MNSRIVASTKIHMFGQMTISVTITSGGSYQIKNVNLSSPIRIMVGFVASKVSIESHSRLIQQRNQNCSIDSSS